MSTNYYCIRDGEKLHIGASRVGWCFQLHVMPEAGIHDLDDWLRLFANQGSLIEDEYGKRLTVDAITAIITARSWNGSRRSGADNNVQRGPRGLLRSPVDGQWCVKDGAGTWDCIVGKFS
jgi:hypothetical protein